MFAAFLFTSFLLLPYQQDTTGRVDGKRIWECFQYRHYNSTKLGNDLIGSWKLTKQYCFWSHKQDLSKTEIVVTFMSDGTYTMTKNSKSFKEGKWKIETKEKSLLLELDKPNYYLSRYIMLCNNEFYFNEMGSDGCECLYLRLPSVK